MASTTFARNIYSILHTRIIKKILLGSSNWIQKEVIQLPSMNGLCMQAQQKLRTHQMFYTELLDICNNKRNPSLSKPKQVMTIHQIPVNLIPTSSAARQSARLPSKSPKWLPQDVQNQSDRLPWIWECGSWEVAWKENVSKHRAPRSPRHKQHFTQNHDSKWNIEFFTLQQIPRYNFCLFQD